ncbi:MAG: hypothetical protein P8Y70_01820 [Candidatus Lokiarchaeota archaeon]
MIIFFLLIQVNSVFYILKSIIPSFDLIIGEGLSITYIILSAIITLELSFIIYLKKYEKFYTLPIIICFYIILGLYLFSNIIYITLYNIASAIIVFMYLFEIGKKNRNGLSMVLGFFVLIYNFSYFTFLIYIQVTIQIFAVVPMILGSIGYIDKFILFDRENEKKIKSSWIARKVR